MSFLSCIGKRSRKKKDKNKEPLDKEGQEKRVELDQEGNPDDNVTQADKDNTPKSSKLSISSRKSTKSADHDDVLQELRTANEKLRAEVDSFKKEKLMLDSESKRTDDTLKSYIDDIHRLEANNMELKSKLTRAEAEAAKVTLENQKLLQKIVGMEEKQAMMSRAELQSMIAQLEEVEKKTSSKSTELSGIRTNPADIIPRKKLSQEERQMSFRLSKAEARLSQSEDENKQLREDLKEMLASHTELQMQLLLDQKEIADMETHLSNSFVDEENSQTFDTDHVETLFARFKKAESDQQKLRNDYNDLQDSYTELEKRLQDAEGEAADREALRKRLEDVENENETLRKAAIDQVEIKKRLEDQETEQVKLKNEMKTLENVCKMISSRLDKVNAENNQFKSKHDVLLKQSRNQKNEMEKLRNEITKLKTENKRLLDENKSLSKQLQKHNVPNGIENNANLQTELSALQAKHKETLNRLSELTSQTIHQNKQLLGTLDMNIATPQTLAEEFRHELYACEWSNSYLIMTQKLKKDEKRTLQILLEICTETFLYCKRAARQQMETVLASLISPTASHYRSGQFSKRGHHMKSSIDQLPDELKRCVSHFRSHPSREMIQSSVKDFLNQIDYERTRFLKHINERELNEIYPYIRKCFDLCWRMTVQDPPMYLLFKVKHGVDIERDRFDKYTNQGRKLDFIVWPAVFQDEVGPCLQKGVAQALPDRL